ncbi:integrase [Pseudoxanthomonas sp. SE1]|uniref:site-specific integrase n=1 Tax=Pseudoxanthomonas sp. SE1 TaxID=1664560 RepID=UPI00240D6243|nr:integrase [Pseudoxanthomonas sp. SE1]WFC43214.1 integrase [Pseudoxanthomonas sp. SE1]
MSPRGRERKFNPTIPAHIDQKALPAGVYWDASGRGRWYVFIQKEGRPARETIAGPTAKLSDLHRLVEEGKGGPTHGTIAWMLAAFHDSTKFKTLAKATQRDYTVCRKIIEEFPITGGGKFGTLMAGRLTQTNVQRLVEKIVRQGHPSKANHVLRYLRRVYKWAGPHLGLKENPAKGIEQAQERRRRRLPPQTVYDAVLAFSRDRGALKPHTKGSQPPYLWMVAELSYLCRLRGIETNTLVEAQGEAEGLRTDRRKGSRNNIVEWSPRLRAAWDAALAHRRGVIARRGQPEQLRPENRFVFLSEDGEPLTKDGLDSAWQRLILKAIEAGVITEEQRFSLHDLKRKGVTDTKGTKRDKQDAAGLTEPMMNVYDLSVPLVKPADAP